MHACGHPQLHDLHRGLLGLHITDGAIRMLVVLSCHQLGYSPFEVAMLFLFYEIFGIVINLVGGWLGARIGLNLTMHIGMALQVVALLMLTLPDPWLSVVYVMAAQLCGDMYTPLLGLRLLDMVLFLLRIGS